MGLSVKVDDAGTTRYDSVKVGDLQENIQINGFEISGHLKYINDESMSKVFGEDEKHGNFICLAFDNQSGGTLKTKVKGGTHDEFVDVSDGFCIYRIKDKDRQSIIIQINNEETEEIEYGLSGLTCDSEPD